MVQTVTSQSGPLVRLLTKQRAMIPRTKSLLVLLSCLSSPIVAKTIRRRFDELFDFNLGSTNLHLFAGAGKDIVSCHRTIRQGTGWHGKCDGGLAANFIQRSNDDGSSMETFGSFNTAGQICHVAPDSNGEATVQCVNGRAMDLEEEAELDDVLDDDETNNRKLSSLNLTFAMGHVDMSNRRELFDDSGATIDLLVVWTPQAECVNSGLKVGCTLTRQTESNMRGLIDLALVETNVAFTLSNISTKLRLVHAYREDTYKEPPAPLIWNTMLSHLTQVGDGQLESVHAKRALYGADVVHMIAGSGGSCGIAHMGPSRKKMFSISRASCATGYYSFGHEIAHTVSGTNVLLIMAALMMSSLVLFFSWVLTMIGRP
jgi:Metallo-peptidase family M12B Reprolysin-like